MPFYIGNYAAVATKARLGLAVILLGASMSACSRPAPAVETPQSRGIEAIASVPAIEPKPEPSQAEGAARAQASVAAVGAAVSAALEASGEADLAALDAVLAGLDEAGLLDEIESALSAALAAEAAAGRVAPGLHLALSCVYGRKGLAAKAYAAIEAAEAAAKAPGVRLSLAAVHGRKALLAPIASSGAFSLSVACALGGAAASLDGGAAQRLPTRFEAWRPGRHELVVSLAGYERLVELVEGKDGQSLSIEARLEPSPVSVTVSTEPAGAELAIDGKPVGASPWTGRLRPGSHEATASLGSYEPGRTVFEVPLGGEPLGVGLSLRPSPARVRIVSDPPGADVQVWVDGEHVGAAPIELALDSPGKHTARSSSGPVGFGPSPAVSFEAGAGESVEVVLRPSAQFGYLYITGDDLSGAYLSVGGLYVGTLPESNQHALPLGSYKVELQKPGYKRIERTVQIAKPGVSNRMEITWIREEAAPEAKAAPLALAARSPKVDGQPGDWGDIAPAITDPPGDDRLAGEPGTDIAAAYLAKDDRYLYARLDFADGRPAKRPGVKSVYSLRLLGRKQDDGSRVTFSCQVEYRDGEWYGQVIKASNRGVGKDTGWTQVSDRVSYAFGDACLELRVPRATLERYLEAGDDPEAWVNYFVQDKVPGTIDDSARVSLAPPW